MCGEQYEGEYISYVCSSKHKAEELKRRCDQAKKPDERFYYYVIEHKLY